MSGNPPVFKEGLRAAGEAGLAAAAACGVLSLVLPAAPPLRWACLGLGLAWLAASAGSVLLAAWMGSSARAFWTAFGAGMALRISVLAGLMAYVWRHPDVPGPALLASYVLGVAVLLLVEYRRLVRRGIAGKA